MDGEPTLVDDRHPLPERPRRDRSVPWLVAGVFVLVIAVAVLATLFLTEDTEDGGDDAAATTTTTAPPGRTQRAPSGSGGTATTDADADADDEDGGGSAVACDTGQLLRILEAEIGETIELRAHSCTTVGGGGAWVSFVAIPELVEPGMAVEQQDAYYTLGDRGWVLIAYGPGPLVDCAGAGLPAETCAALS